MTTRSATPDLCGALSRFRAEFDVLAEDHPHDGNGLIIDAGGYIGIAAIALTKVYLACTMITIEPSSKNFAALLKNTEGFKTIRPINATLTVESGLGSVDLFLVELYERADFLGEAIDSILQ